jgi:serine/threonine protein kinase
MEYQIKDIQTKSINSVSLTNAHFITEGGEGKVFGKNDTIYKIYIEPKKMISLSKIHELSYLDKDNILKPLNIILDKKGIQIGFTMKWLKNSTPICKLFTSDFWTRFNINNKIISELVKNMINDIKYIHSKNCLIVDGNEMNYLIDSKNFIFPYFIDVDSYQTSSFPATAIMTSIRDLHSNTFSELTDWFSFGIISIQLFIGIHPFKGTHPDYSKKDLEKRMKDNISIFNKDVRLPATVRDLNCIPKEYKDWYIKLFEKGERLPPPQIGIVTVSIINKKIINNSDSFKISLFKEIENDIVKIDDEGNIYSKIKIYIDKGEYDSNVDSDLIYSIKSFTPIKVHINEKKMILEKLNGEKINCIYECNSKTLIDNHLYILNDDKLLAIEIDEIGKTFIPVVKTFWNVLPNSTKLYSGIIYQDILGLPYFNLPYISKNGNRACMTKLISELKKYKIVEMKNDKNVIFVIAFKNGKYDRFIFKVNDDYSEYNCQKFEDVTYHVPNFVTLDNGVVVSINDDDQVEIFSRSLLKSDINIIEDKHINYNMKLWKKGVNVFITEENRMYNFSMKKNEREIV